jgi:hypothetical protein
MGFLDEINKAMKTVEEEVKKANLDKQFKDLGDGINKAGSGAPKDTTPAGTSVPSHPVPSASPARKPHPGYSRITAWMKTRYKGKIDTITDPSIGKLELEQVSAEATSGLSHKARQGFLDYLKSQNYEQLLK